MLQELCELVSLWIKDGNFRVGEDGGNRITFFRFIIRIGNY